MSSHDESNRELARLRAEVTLLGWIVTAEAAALIVLAFKVWL